MFYYIRNSLCRKLEVKAFAAKSLQSYPTLCDPIDGSPPGSPSLGFSRQEHWSGLPLPSPKTFEIRKNRLTTRPSLRPSAWMSSPRVWLLSVVGAKTRRRKQHSSWHNEQGEGMWFSMRGVG